MLREHRIHRWPYVGLLALVAIMVAGCGGNSEEEDIKEVVEPAILADARETISPPSPPAYLDARMGELRVEDLQVRRQGERAATVRAVVRVPVELKPKPDKEEFLRVVPASGGAVTLSRPVEAAVTGKSLGLLAPEDKKMMAGYGSFDETIDALEQAVSQGPFVCGEQFTAADVYVGSQIGWGLMFGSIDKRPAFEEYFGRISARPAARRAAEIDDALIAEQKKAQSDG